MVALINAYNLIDGIDGLAGIAGIVICSAFAFVFYLVREPYFVLLSIMAVGILAAFLRYNFSRSHRKMFMGDGGSLTIGFLIAFLSLKILVMKESPVLSAHGFLPENRALFLLAVLFLPVFDTLRVMVIRLLNKKSPFEADRNHLHHVLLDNKLSHKQASLALGGLNILIIAAYIFISRELESLGMSLFMLFLVVGVALAFEFLKRRAERLKTRKTLRPKGIKVQLRKRMKESSFFTW